MPSSYASGLFWGAVTITFQMRQSSTALHLGLRIPHCGKPVAAPPYPKGKTQRPQLVFERDRGSAPVERIFGFQMHNWRRASHRIAA